MEQQTQWTRPGYRPNYNGGTPPPHMGNMNRTFSQTVTPELSRAERLEAQRLAEQSRFDPNAYQVVRREFIANRFCPSMTIRNKSITFNNACISALEDAIYVQFLINPTELKLAMTQYAIQYVANTSPYPVLPFRLLITIPFLTLPLQKQDNML